MILCRNNFCRSPQNYCLLKFITKSNATTTEDKHNRVTLRQTQVLVIPANDEMTQNFPVFDAVINAINQARRGARDLVTDYSLEKIDEQMYGEVEDRDWV